MSKCSATISVTAQVEFAQVERIVTTLAVIDSDEGIPLDYNYNETIKEEELTSAPGCPKSIDGFPWVYYGDPPKCHLSGFRGPCGENQLLFLKDFESNEGVCVCEICEKYLISGAPIQVSPDKRYKFCGPDHVYDKTSRQCYDLNAQGSCEQAQWLVKDSSGVNVKCVPECPKSEESDKVMKYDHNKGECVLMVTVNFSG
ncbi:hypothetical protein Ocin01_15019 [Orchesella cincta]|uniref:DUF4789 domain-containing protein n=1 Tax=Orchesella cincta TaxID=48709 RepID=A0A1D2MF70_ORCCI|nr:hypothetical protein Ocin01_15019 [Orchesella cincta]